MNTRYTVTSNGYWWDVRNPRGQRVECLPREQWSRAVHLAHKFSTTDQVRDQKHRELFSPCPGQGLRQLVNVLTKAAQAQARQADYALTN